MHMQKLKTKNSFYYHIIGLIITAVPSRSVGESTMGKGFTVGLSQFISFIPIKNV